MSDTMNIPSVLLIKWDLNRESFVISQITIKIMFSSRRLTSS